MAIAVTLVRRRKCSVDRKLSNQANAPFQPALIGHRKLGPSIELTGLPVAIQSSQSSRNITDRNARATGERATGRAAAARHYGRTGNEDICQAVLTMMARPHRGSLVQPAVLQRLEDVTFLDAVVDCTETSLSSLGEVRKC